MKYRPKTKPWPHQKRALKFLIRHRGGAVFVPMRGGKCKITLDFAHAAELAWGIQRLCVVAPLSALGTWKSEIRKHLPDESELEILLINYERLYKRESTGEGREWEPIDHDRLAAWIEHKSTLMVCDESHRLAKPTSLQSKKAYRLGQAAKLRVILTGTAWHRKPIGIFGQLRFLDDRVLGTSYSAFKGQYAVYGGYGGFILKHYINLDILKSKVKSKAFTMKYVPLHPPTEQVIPVPLGKEAVDAYRQMAEESLVELRDSDVVATIPLTRALRLAQIAGGWAKDEEGQTHRIHTDLREAYRDWLKDRYEEGLEKLVVYARFRPELLDVAQTSASMGYQVLLLHGGVSGNKREQRIAEFDETSTPTVFVVQVNTGSEGIDLSASEIAVYYSLPQDLVPWDQSHARIRKFKDKITRGYYYFIPELPEGKPTVTGITLASLKAGKDLAETMDKDPLMVFESAL